MYDTVLQKIYSALCNSCKLFLYPIVMCPPLDDPKNGEVFIKQEENKVVIICEDGFKLIGNDTIYCVDGMWNSPLPTCSYKAA